MKSILTHIAAAYMGAGLFGGLVMQAAVPATNALGVAYYTAAWPAFLHCAKSQLKDCDPMSIIPEGWRPAMFDLERAEYSTLKETEDAA